MTMLHYSSQNIYKLLFSNATIPHRTGFGGSKLAVATVPLPCFGRFVRDSYMTSDTTLSAWNHQLKLTDIVRAQFNMDERLTDQLILHSPEVHNGNAIRF